MIKQGVPSYFMYCTGAKRRRRAGLHGGAVFPGWFCVDTEAGVVDEVVSLGALDKC